MTNYCGWQVGYDLIFPLSATYTCPLQLDIVHQISGIVTRHLKEWVYLVKFPLFRPSSDEEFLGHRIQVSSCRSILREIYASILSVFSEDIHTWLTVDSSVLAAFFFSTMFLTVSSDTLANLILHIESVKLLINTLSWNIDTKIKDLDVLVFTPFFSIWIRSDVYFSH